MLLESLLAFAHLSAILGLTAFITAMAVLCRPQWANAAALRRLRILDRWVLACTLAVLLTGLARIHLGVKDAAWLWSQPLLHAKLALFALMGWCGWQAHRRITAWHASLQQTGALPSADELRRTRRWLMLQAHLMAPIPLAAVLLARGALTL